MPCAIFLMPWASFPSPRACFSMPRAYLLVNPGVLSWAAPAFDRAEQAEAGPRLPTSPVTFPEGLVRSADRQGRGKGQPLVENYVLIILNAVVPLKEQGKRNRDENKWKNMTNQIMSKLNSSSD